MLTTVSCDWSVVTHTLIPRKSKESREQDYINYHGVLPCLFVEDNMDNLTLSHILREQVTCHVCSDLFKNPRQLPCLHSFCLHCLQDWAGQQASDGRDAFSCPKCRSLCRLPPSGDLKDLPVSFYLNGLIDFELAIKECDTTQLTCGKCDKKSPEASYCFQCCKFYCEQCLIGHNMMLDYKEHRVLAVKQFQGRDYEDVLKRPAFCSKPRHEKEELKFFCTDCATPVCQSCFTLQFHPGHTLVHIEDEAEKQRKEMRDMEETQRQNLQEKRHEAEQLKEGNTNLVQLGENVKRNVQTFFDNLIAVLEAKKQSIFEAVENQTKQLDENLTTETIKIENEVKVIESWLETVEKLLKRSELTADIAEVVRLRAFLQTVFEGTVQTQPVAQGPGNRPTLVFVKNEKLMDTVKEQEIGSLEISHHTKASQCITEGKGLKKAFVGVEANFNLITRNYPETMRYNKNDLVTVEILDEQKRDCKMGVRVHDNETGRYDISYCPRDQGKYSISVKVNEQHVCGSPYDLLVETREQAFNPRNLSVRGKNSGGHSPSPIVSRDFSPKSGAFLQAISGKPIKFKPLSFGMRGSSVGMFKCPWGVAVNDTDEIAVTDQFNNRVQIFDIKGNYLRSFGSKGFSQGRFSYPHGICFDNNSDIFVTDTNNNRIQIFSREGEYKGMFGGQGSLDSQLFHPWGLSLDANGDIIVADSCNKVIKIFTTNGKFVRKIGETGAFSFPVHCVQCDENLIVSDKVEHCIKVFSTQGKFLFKFGQKGDGDGEFNSPFGLAITKSKHLMVCDMNNHRVQLFELNGRFVGKFGSNGSKLGEFSWPTSVAVLSDGRIVVCEWLNHRIQFFSVDEAGGN